MHRNAPCQQTPDNHQEEGCRVVNPTNPVPIMCQYTPVPSNSPCAGGGRLGGSQADQIRSWTTSPRAPTQGSSFHCMPCTTLRSSETGLPQERSPHLLPSQQGRCWASGPAHTTTRSHNSCWHTVVPQKPPGLWNSPPALHPQCAGGFGKSLPQTPLCSTTAAICCP